MIAVLFHKGIEGPPEWPALIARDLAVAPSWAEQTFATEADLQTYLESVRPANNAWLANKAPALITAMKTAGKTKFDAADEDGRLSRAVAETLLDEINILRGQIIGTGSVVWDPASMANATGLTSANIAVTGAAFGDFVDVAAPYSLAGITATAYVAAAGQVAVRLHNGTGAAVNLASGTWTVCVRRLAALPARTPAQARTSIQNKIDAQP